MVTEIPEGKSVYPQGSFPRTPEYDVRHLLLSEETYLLSHIGKKTYFLPLVLYQQFNPYALFLSLIYLCLN